MVPTPPKFVSPVEVVNKFDSFETTTGLIF
jgi:hypothetical protein